MTSPGYRPVPRLAPLAALLALLPATADAGKKRVVPDVVEDALAYATTDRDRAIELLQQTLAERPDATVELYLAEQLRLAGDDEGAREHLVKLGSAAVGPDRDAADLGLALLDAAGGHLDRASEILRSVSEKEALATQNADRFLLLAVDAAHRDDGKEVGSDSRKALGYAKEDPAVLTRIRQALDALANGQEPQIAPSGGEGDGDPLTRAEAAYAKGDREEALKLATRAAEAGGDDAARAEGLVRSLQGHADDPHRIAVLLPLSGKFGAVGQQVEEALRFGYGSAPVELEVVDSGGTADSAVQALEHAVLDEGAIAVVGGLLTDESDAVIAAAESLHVPLLSLSQTGPTGEHHWTFQAMYTRGDQVDALLDFVTKEKGMDSFAVFSPDNPFGQNAAELFEQGVAARSGKISTSATYSPDETSLIPYAAKLGTRTGNLAELRKEAVANGGKADTVVLPPVLDFDAIFLPESANRTPVAAAALAYEEFPMGEYVPQGPQHVIPLLGLSSWNTANLVTSGNEYTRGSYFPDVFSPTVAGDSAFVTAYRAATDRTPTALEAAMVDAGKLLGAAVRASPETRGAMRQALLDVKVDDAITGADGFDPETLRARRTMLILTVTRTTLEQVGTVQLDGHD